MFWLLFPAFSHISLVTRLPSYQYAGKKKLMKTLAHVFLLSLLAWKAANLCVASSIGPATIEQPVNLGPKSDPGRIPLGSIGVICNYDYGLHKNIGASRPAPDGAMRWETGTELDQNLASVFGISVEAQDPTQIREFPVALRLKSWKPPGYSPYTKDQVLAATLWCLVRSAGGTPEKPLEVRVVAEGPDDKPLEAKYSGKYITRPGKDGKEVPPVKVPGTTIETDARGIAWVVFPDVTRKVASPAPPPTITILATGGESDTGWFLLPVWDNWSGGSEEKSNSVTLSMPREEQPTLAAEIIALVISAQPTENRPLTVSIRLEEYGLANYPAFRSAPGWKETRHDPHNITLECEFVWDAAARKLTKGSVPLVQLNSAGNFISPIPEGPPTKSDGSELAETVRSRIQNGIHNGSLLAEKNMADDMLADSGLQRQIGLAGYYEALATFFDEGEVSDKPAKSTVHRGSSEFDQLYRMGWTIGLNRGQAIVIDARKSIEEAKRKKGE
jgi:hypothetical protein